MFVITFMVWIVITLYHNLVTVKYASLSEGEYRKLTSCTYDDLIDEYQDQLQLITGWLGLHLNFIDYEILASGTNIYVYIYICIYIHVYMYSIFIHQILDVCISSCYYSC